MVEDDGVRWNSNLVRHWFLEEEVDLILSIPLSLFHPTDSLIWAKEPKGLFTTKSAYFVARLCQGMAGDEPTGSVVSEKTKFLWKTLWLAKVPGKVKICVWREIMNALPSKVNLKKRRVLTEATCGFCDQEEETVEHALLKCPRVAAVWFGSPLGLRFFTSSENGFGGWLEHMAHEVSKESFELLLILVWSIWKVRNDFLWNGVDVSPLNTQIKAQTWLAEYRKWNDAIPQHSLTRILRWQTSASGWIKCNFDAAWDDNGSIGGFGLVVRDAEEGVRSALHVEVAAAQAATLFLRRWSTKQVHVEWNAGVAYSGHYGHLFEDTRELLQELRQWKITFGRREMNKGAHRLARFNLTIDHLVYWFEEPPDVISDLLLEDSTSS